MEKVGKMHDGEKKKNEVKVKMKEGDDDGGGGGKLFSSACSEVHPLRPSEMSAIHSSKSFPVHRITLFPKLT
jgi:hypothetical protein